MTIARQPDTVQHIQETTHRPERKQDSSYYAGMVIDKTKIRPREEVQLLNPKAHVIYAVALSPVDRKDSNWGAEQADNFVYAAPH